MKTRAFILILLIAVFLSGCLVKSLHPFYKESDVIFDETLLGTWLDEDSATWRINPFTFSKGFMKGDSTDNSYLVEMFDDTAKISKFNVHLFNLKEKQFLDFVPIQDDRYEEIINIHLVPTHSIARILFVSEDEAIIAWFDEEWLNSLFEENRVKIAHEVVKVYGDGLNKEYVLTASTQELQKFIIKYGNDEDAYFCDDKNSNFMCARLKRIK